jgi:hypothetical protein
VSDSFRDLEQPDSAHRKDAVLMATISGLEYLDRPTRQDMARFSKLFLPLFDAASGPTRRTASAALSRLPRVPDDVAQMLINQPIDIAAPFIAQYAGSRKARLRARSRAWARRMLALRPGVPIFRRRPFPPCARLTTRPSKDCWCCAVWFPILPNKPRSNRRRHRHALKAPSAAQWKRRRSTRVKIARELARNGASRSRAESTAQPAGEFPKQACSPAPMPASRLPPPAGPPQRPPSADWPKHGLGQLARYAKPDHESWFATALADAMETSYALAERIMMDLSRPATGNRPDRPECPLQHHQSRA